MVYKNDDHYDEERTLYFFKDSGELDENVNGWESKINYWEPYRR